MNIVEQSHEIITDISEGGVKELELIERCGRIAYQSHKKNPNHDFVITKKFVRGLIKLGHESVLEHGSMTVIFVTDRAVANELVRHRIASYTQESTRYCDYDKMGLTFIRPVDVPRETMRTSRWYAECGQDEWTYNAMRVEGKKPEEARAILPLCLKTEIAVTTNWREWRHILRLRTERHAHPQMRALMLPLLEELKARIPVLFDDIKEE